MKHASLAAFSALYCYQVAAWAARQLCRMAMRSHCCFAGWSCLNLTGLSISLPSLDEQGLTMAGQVEGQSQKTGTTHTEHKRTYALHIALRNKSIIFALQCITLHHTGNRTTSHHLSSSSLPLVKAQHNGGFSNKTIRLSVVLLICIFSESACLPEVVQIRTVTEIAA